MLLANLCRIVDLQLIKVQESLLHEGYLALLPSHSILKIKAYKFRKDQILAFTSEYLKYVYIPKLLHKMGYISKVVDEIKFTISDHGKPFLQDYPNIHFNISHTSGFVALVVTKDCQVGIDIEHEDRNASYTQVAKTVFSEYECSILDKSSVDHCSISQDFFKLWTKKESLLKALGSGFTNSELYISTKLNLDNYQYLPNHNAFLFSRSIDSLILSVCIIP